MYRSSRLRATALVLLTLAIICEPPAVLGQDKPPLSEEIKKAIDADGAAAGTARFKELFPAQRDRFEIDVKQFGDLSSSYIQAGNMEAGMAIANMMSALVQEQYAEAMAASAEVLANVDEMAAAARQEQAQRESREAEEAAARAEEAGAQEYDRGPARDDLDRFTGMYDDPENDNETRQLFVLPTCDGYLTAGPMWADVTPWFLTSHGELSFSTHNQYQELDLTFQVGPDGSATAMVHSLDFIGSPLVRIGGLPVGWSECVSTER